MVGFISTNTGQKRLRAAESQSQKWFVITSTSFRWGGNAALSLLNGVRVNRGYVQNVQRSRRERSAPVHKHFVLCSLTLCKQTQTMTQCAGILTQTSWGRYIIQLRLRCHCWFMFLWNAMCGAASESLVSRPFVYFQVQNLTLAFQAAESVGIKPSLVSWCAADRTRSLCHSRGASLVQQLWWTDATKPERAMTCTFTFPVFSNINLTEDSKRTPQEWRKSILCLMGRFFLCSITCSWTFCDITKGSPTSPRLV